jgi:glycerol 3-phosphatase-2
VIGKPNPPLFHAARERAGGGRPLVVGDRLDTDVAGAVELGWDSMLVLTGISSRSDVDASSFRPTYVAEDVSWLVREESVDDA